MLYKEWGKLPKLVVISHAVGTINPSVAVTLWEDHTSDSWEVASSHPSAHCTLSNLVFEENACSSEELPYRMASFREEDSTGLYKSSSRGSPTEPHRAPVCVLLT